MRQELVEDFFNETSSDEDILDAVTQVANAVADVHATIPDILPAYAMLREALGDDIDEIINGAGPDLEDLRLCSRIGVAPTKAQDVCSVCHEAIEAGEIYRELRCHHVFHQCCVDRALETSHTCPLCRTPVVADRIPTFEHEPDAFSSTP